MSEKTAEVWVCDVCGHTWIKGEKEPTHCASSKCRSRRWNSGHPVTDCHGSDQREQHAQDWKDLLHDHHETGNVVRFRHGANDREANDAAWEKVLSDPRPKKSLTLECGQTIGKTRALPAERVVEYEVQG